MRKKQCNHTWHFVGTEPRYKPNTDNPIARDYIFLCDKCGHSKAVEPANDNILIKLIEI